MRGQLLQLAVGTDTHPPHLLNQFVFSSLFTKEGYRCTQHTQAMSVASLLSCLSACCASNCSCWFYGAQLQIDGPSPPKQWQHIYL